MKKQTLTPIHAMKKNTLVLASSLLFLIPATGSAATLAHYPVSAAPPLNSSTTDPNITASAIGNITTPANNGNAAVMYSSSQNIYYNFLSQLDKDQAISANYYTAFTLTPDEGFMVSYSQLSFNYGGSFGVTGASVDANFFVRSSLDGFTSDLTEFTYTIPSLAGGGNVPELMELELSSLSQFQDVATPVTFRIYAFVDNFMTPNNFNSSARPRIDNILFEGSVNAIPEPTSAILLLTALTGMTVFSSHRRR